MAPLAASIAVRIFILVPLIGTVLFAASQELKGDRPGGVHKRLPDE